jgi:DNA-binding transcriptional regulator YiaG
MNDYQKYRAQNIVSRSDLAKALGVHYETLAKWERGERKPQAIALTALRFYLILKKNELI